jgi:hypothetical protein
MSRAFKGSRKQRIHASFYLILLGNMGKFEAIIKEVLFLIWKYRKFLLYLQRSINNPLAEFSCRVRAQKA